MAKDDPREALRELIENSKGAAVLGSGSGSEGYKRLGTGTAAENLREHLRQQAEAAANAPVRLYIVIDTTYSMGRAINAVRSAAGNIGQEVLKADKRIEACVLGFGEHQGDKFPQGILPPGSSPWGDYGQFNSLTTQMEIFIAQAQGIVGYEEARARGKSFHNATSDPEAYECAAHDLGSMILEAKIRNPEQKHVVVLIGDAHPHGIDRYDPHPCPSQRGPEQIRFLVENAEHTYFIDAKSAGGTTGTFETKTFGQVEGHPKATYLEFAKAEDVLPEAIIGMVKKERGQLDAYVAMLTAGGHGYEAGKVAGLLGTGRK